MNVLNSSSIWIVNKVNGCVFRKICESLNKFLNIFNKMSSFQMKYFFPFLLILRVFISLYKTIYSIRGNVKNYFVQTNTNS